MRGMAVLGALFVVAFGVARGNANAGIFVLLAVVCLGACAVLLLARGLARGGGARLPRHGLDREVLVGGLLLIGLLTPWSVAIPTLHWPAAFGWQSPALLAIIGALILARVRPLRRYAMPTVIVAGLGLAAWAGWVSAQLLTAAFRTSHFPFLPIDLLGEGWYVGLLAFAVVVDGLASDASVDERPARPSEVWPFSIVTGAGLVRLHYHSRGRLWMAGAAFSVFLLQAMAIVPAEFQFYGSQGSLPPPRPRGAALLPVALGLLIWLASLRETQLKLRLEQNVDESPVAAMGRSRPAGP